VSRKTQRKPRAVHVTMGVQTMRLDPEDEHRLCIETRVKPGATVVPHNKWVNGSWRDKETGQLLRPPEYGKTYLVDLNIADSGNFLIAHPSQQT
jgi:FtsP/CotA-like multicopper oxidase with cupredoxin domain